MNRQRLKELMPVLKAFEEGKDIQYRARENEYPRTWQDTDSIKNVERFEYRVKPKPEKTEPYRRFAYRNNEGKAEVALVWSISGANGAVNHSNFLGWIDTEWQQHELPNQES